ncbi:hypothetical protein ABB02_01066 [Clostridiaceae bacterium JG1575]|nr:hypothetical protein ABB02_01066 [Clostridiaceae bacterium JG1575]
MFKNIRGVIFDLDGTLVDSMWVWSKIDQDFIESRSLSITPEELMNVVAHFSFHQTAHYFKDTFSLPESVDEIKALWIDAAHREYSTSVTLKAGAREFLLRLKELGIKLALATSNNRDLLEVCLQANGILGLFDALVTTDESRAKTKAEPDVFLLAAQRIGVSPQECMVFEDVAPAMRGARAAGMRVVGIKDRHTSLPEGDEALAERFLEDFQSLLFEESLRLPER